MTPPISSHRPVCFPLASVRGKAGGLMSILSRTTFTEGKCINSWSASTLHSARSSEGARMSQGEAESLMHALEKKKKKHRQKWRRQDAEMVRWQAGSAPLLTSVTENKRDKVVRHKWLGFNDIKVNKLLSPPLTASRGGCPLSGVIN